MHETAVQYCARCGGDHAAVRFEPLTHPIRVDSRFVEPEGGEYVLASHWAPCPENGEPILMRFNRECRA